MRRSSAEPSTYSKLASNSPEEHSTSFCASRASTSPDGDPGEAGPEPSVCFTDTSLDLLHVNVRGFVSHQAILEMHLEELGHLTIVGLTETWLNRALGSISLSRYSLVSRRDRGEQMGGGIELFVRTDSLNGIVHLVDSWLSERSWYLLHTCHGPFVLCLRYIQTQFRRSFFEVSSKFRRCFVSQGVH